MKASFVISYTRGDGTTLTREARVESQRVYERGGFRSETRTEFSKRVRRLVESAIKGTVGS